MPKITPVEPPRILRLKDVMNTTGLSRTTVYRFIAAGEFPSPIKLGPLASGWIASEIDAWITARLAARRQI